MSSAAGRQLPVILRELAWTIHKRAPDRAGVGPLPTTEVALLKQIVDAPGCTVSQLATALGLHQPNASGALRVLVHRGLVERAPDPADRRTIRVIPTALGLTEHEAIAAGWAADVADAIAELDSAHRDALEAASDAMVQLTLIVRGGER
ncbi:MarR family winged helix-turn-helix transcriptional regulator [Microbacterium elymi]|uniref:MarR family transcriptional regulator n=1 Tax=Microbacterium elymi TaxID=2909587 RepID=A0ABY5NHW4_9MICO|nr:MULTISPECIES: MarR family transcriptional regulator [Microbacterium]UUT34767.1 MarR family transcriptional regulator [Microbacterium elymi]